MDSEGFRIQKDTECEYNATADALAEIAAATTSEGDCSLARWIQHQAGHLGAQATHRWAQARGIDVSLSILRQIKDVGNHSKHGKCGSAPTWKTSGERSRWAGPTSMDKFSCGESGLHCT